MELSLTDELPDGASAEIYARLAEEGAIYPWTIRYVWSRRPEAWAVVLVSGGSTRAYTVVRERGDEWVAYSAEMCDPDLISPLQGRPPRGGGLRLDEQRVRPRLSLLCPHRPSGDA